MLAAGALLLRRAALPTGGATLQATTSAAIRCGARVAVQQMRTEGMQLSHTQKAQFAALAASLFPRSQQIVVLRMVQGQQLCAATKASTNTAACVFSASARHFSTFSRHAAQPLMKSRSAQAAVAATIGRTFRASGRQAHATHIGKRSLISVASAIIATSSVNAKLLSTSTAFSAAAAAAAFKCGVGVQSLIRTARADISAALRPPGMGGLQRGARAVKTGGSQQARGYTLRALTQGQGLLSPTSPDRIVKVMIAANVAVFCAWQLNPGEFMQRHFTTSPQAMRDGRIHTLFTAAFSQMTIGHLATNMVTLYFFGNEVARVYGPRLFLQLYCGAGILASGAHVAWRWYRAVHMQGGQKIPAEYREWRLRTAASAVGASGAVEAVLAVAVLLNPWGTVVVLPIPIPMPLCILGGLYMAHGVNGAYHDEGQVSHVAHLAGAALGAAVFMGLRRGYIRRQW